MRKNRYTSFLNPTKSVQKIGVFTCRILRNILSKIFSDVILPYAEEETPLRWVFQQDNHPKRTSKLEKQQFDDNKISWHAQSPDLNRIENLWGDVKRARNLKIRMIFGKQHKQLGMPFQKIDADT